MLTPEQLQFIEKHASEDLQNLALRFRREDIAFLLNQILGRRIAESKLPKWYSIPQIVYPKHVSIEQSSSQVTAEYKATLLPSRCCSFVDLTGGMGVDFSFLAPHFQQAVYVESNEELCSIAKYNMPFLGIKNAQIVNTTANQYIQSLIYADVVYIDPSRRSSKGQKVFRIEDCSPNLIEIISKLLPKTQRIIIKYSPMLDISLALQIFLQTAQIHVVSVENDCKELLFILTDTPIDSLVVHTVNFRNNQPYEFFKFQWEEEKNVKPIYTSNLLQYLYEPNTSILKAGAFSVISKYFNIEKLHPSTHLYTSNSLIKKFPGRVFSVREIFQHTKSNLKEIISKYPKANISIRNFPMTVAEIRKKTKIKDGGEIYIFATTLANNQKKWIICDKVK